MARQNHGPLSRAKGKIGGVVYQQYEGMQVSREYQPVVKNPQTTKQVENRAKFKMASQIVAEFSEVLNARLGNLSIYTRIRRGASVNAIYAIIDPSTPPTAQALVSDVVSSINAKSVSGISNITLNDVSLSFEMTVPTGYTVIYTQCGYNTNGTLTNRMTETYTSNGSAKTINFIGPKTDIIMAVSVRALTDAGRAVISNISVNSTGNAWVNEIARGVASGDIEISNMVGNTHTA